MLGISLLQLLVALFVVGVLALLVRAGLRAGPDPVGGRATPPPTPSCDVSAELAILTATTPLPARIVLDPASLTQVSVADTIVLPAGVTLQPLTPITLIAENDIVIDGNIDPFSSFPGAPDQKAFPITIVSRSGQVIVSSTARIGAGSGRRGDSETLTVRNPRAAGSAGESGPLISFHGISVTIDGRLTGIRGGDGGTAFASARPVLGTGGSALAAGGQGGFGGHVLICAEEAIQVGATALIRGGGGGTGGHATAKAKAGARAVATGGPSAKGGDVVFTGTGPRECLLTVAAPATPGLNSVNGGGGGRGGTADATGGDLGTVSVATVGGPARATAGDGGEGGTVRFVNCVVARPAGMPIRAGNGGSGNAAMARGGKGSDGTRLGTGSGGDGGTAMAEGGDGAAAGLVPVFVFTDGSPGQGTRLRSGSGGDASATAGNGGDRTVITFFATAGRSGYARAEGGFNGDGLPGMPPVAEDLGALPTGATGGVALEAFSFGAK